MAVCTYITSAHFTPETYTMYQLYLTQGGRKKMTMKRWKERADDYSLGVVHHGKHTSDNQPSWVNYLAKAIAEQLQWSWTQNFVFFLNNSVNVHLENRSFRKFSFGKFACSSKLVIWLIVFKWNTIWWFSVHWPELEQNQGASRWGFSFGELCTVSSWF